MPVVVFSALALLALPGVLADEDTSTRSLVCMFMRDKSQCKGYDGEKYVLSPRDAGECQQACENHGYSGCCEWQEDWEKCLFYPGEPQLPKNSDEMRAAANCRVSGGGRKDLTTCQERCTTKFGTWAPDNQTKFCFDGCSSLGKDGYESCKDVAPGADAIGCMYGCEYWQNQEGPVPKTSCGSLEVGRSCYPNEESPNFVYLSPVRADQCAQLCEANAAIYSFDYDSVGCCEFEVNDDSLGGDAANGPCVFWSGKQQYFDETSSTYGATCLSYVSSGSANVCPGYAQTQYCDCTEDCDRYPDTWCGCSEAQSNSCCNVATSVQTSEPTSVSTSDQTKQESGNDGASSSDEATLSS